MYSVASLQNSQVVKHVHHSMIKPIPPNLCPQEPSMVEPDLHESITEETHDGIFVVTRSRCDAAPTARTSQVNLNNSNGSPGLSSAAPPESGPSAPRRTARVTAGQHPNSLHRAGVVGLLPLRSLALVMQLPCILGPGAN